MLDFSGPEGMARPRTASGPFAYRARPRFVTAEETIAIVSFAQTGKGRHNPLLRKRGKVATILVYARGGCATGSDPERKCLMLDLHSCRLILLLSEKSGTDLPRTYGESKLPRQPWKTPTLTSTDP